MIWLASYKYVLLTKRKVWMAENWPNSFSIFSTTFGISIANIVQNIRSFVLSLLQAVFVLAHD